jgi:hypothetical protein
MKLGSPQTGVKANSSKRYTNDTKKIQLLTQIDVYCAEGKIIGSDSSSLHPEDGGSKVLRNGGNLPHQYTVLQPKRLRREN